MSEAVSSVSVSSSSFAPDKNDDLVGSEESEKVPVYEDEDGEEDKDMVEKRNTAAAAVEKMQQ